MKILLKKLLIIFGSYIFLSAQTAQAYSEGMLGVSGALFPKTTLSGEKIKIIGGLNIKADFMNNSGYSLGIGHTSLARKYHCVDMRALHWWNEHLNGFYFGLAGHLQHTPVIGVGAGVNIGYVIPLTYYFNFFIDAEAGCGSSKFVRAGYDPIYYIGSIGLSFNIF